MALNFGDTPFTLTNLRVARLKSDGTYDTVSVALTYGSKLTFKVAADNDMIKAYGMVVEALSVATHVEGEFEQAAFDSDGLWIIAGIATTSSGTTPNAVLFSEFLAGSSGLPYFGIVGSYAAPNGANALVGIRKCKLDTMPGWEVDQNKFRIVNVGFKGLPLNTTGRSIVKVRRNETEIVIPTDMNVYFAA